MAYLDPLNEKDCSQMAAGAEVFLWSFNWERIHAQGHSCSCWQDSVPCRLLDKRSQFLFGFWSEPTLSLLPCGLLHVATCFIIMNKQNKCKKGLGVFCHLITEVTSHWFCCILFIRSKIARSRPHSRWRDYIRMGIQVGKYLGIYIRSYLPQ